MLSNEIIEINMTINDETGKPEITETILNKSDIVEVKEYLKNPKCIDNMKLPILKKNLKHYKNAFSIPSSTSEKRVAKQVIKNIYDFALMGNKKILLERLKKYFEQERLAIQIQKMVRTLFVKRSLSLVGPAIKNRSICTNDTDFYTFEPLDNIPYDNFFSYKDEHNFIYGFELSSLMEYIKNKRRGNKHLTNPYTRGSLVNVLPNIRKLARLNNIIFMKNLRWSSNSEKTVKKSTPSRVISNSYQSRSLLLGMEYQYNHSAMLEFVRSTRAKSINERTQSLFMEIDQLGNYSDCSWFDNLDRRDYLRYFRILKDIWCYRAQIPTSIKIKICPLWDPFIMLSTDDLIDLTTEQLKSRCLCVMEDMVYTGVDVEFKTLGAFHVLSVLTIVSRDARVNMPWLYESLM